jgi:hypothetical protein
VSTSFTPPVKLQNEKQQQLQTTNISRALFNQECSPPQDDVCKTYTMEQEEEDLDERQSIASVPSLIKADIKNTPVVKKESFVELLSRVGTSKNASSLFDSTGVDVDATEDDTSEQTNSPVNWTDRPPLVSLNTSRLMQEDANSDNEEDEEDILYEFIDEFYKQKSTNGSGDLSNEEDNTDTSYNEEEEEEDANEALGNKAATAASAISSQMPLFINPLKQESEMLVSRLLPKIEEESEETTDELLKRSLLHSHSTGKPGNLSKYASNSSMASSSCCTKTTQTNSALSNKIVWTKTAKLRLASKLKPNIKKASQPTTTARVISSSSLNKKENLSEAKHCVSKPLTKAFVSSNIAKTTTTTPLTLNTNKKLPLVCGIEQQHPVIGVGVKRHLSAPSVNQSSYHNRIKKNL